MRYSLTSKQFLIPSAIAVLLGFVSGNVAIGIAVFFALMMPAFVRLYIPYAHDNPDHVWFKRKLYGWGWTPVTWQGWLITCVYIGALTAFGLTIDESSPVREIAFTFVIPALLLTGAFMRIAYKTGEKPKWQWGQDRTDATHR